MPTSSLPFPLTFQESEDLRQRIETTMYPTEVTYTVGVLTVNGSASGGRQSRHAALILLTTLGYPYELANKILDDAECRK